jgi:hypothetical protein
VALKLAGAPFAFTRSLFRRLPIGMDRLRRSEIRVRLLKPIPCAFEHRVFRLLDGARLALEAPNKERSMNLVVWLPAMFALGLAGLGLCYAFVFACEVI